MAHHLAAGAGYSQAAIARRSGSRPPAITFSDIRTLDADREVGILGEGFGGGIDLRIVMDQFGDRADSPMLAICTKA